MRNFGNAEYSLARRRYTKRRFPDTLLMKGVYSARREGRNLTGYALAVPLFLTILNYAEMRGE